MLPVIVGIGLTLFLGMALVLVLLTGDSPVAARLAEVTGTDKALEDAAPTKLAGITANFTEAANRLRKALGLGASQAAARRLALAGYRRPEQVEMYYAARLLLPFLTVLAVSLLVRKDMMFWIMVAIVIGFVAPEFWLTSAIRRRREAVRLALPDALDLLMICMEAGLGLDQALIRVGAELKVSHPDLSDELLLINLEQRAGAQRLDAWRHMADRTALEVVRAFVSMLVQTERFGTPISRSLGIFADSLRTRRRQLAEEMAAKTSIKLIFPLVLFVFPSMFVVLLAPAMITISHNLGGLLK